MSCSPSSPLAPRRAARAWPRPQVALAGLGLLVGLLLLLPPAAADVIPLRTGERIKGRPLQERSDENVLVVEDWISGALRRLAWEALEPKARDDIQEQWGWKDKAATTIKGHRVVVSLQGGGTEELLGFVERRDESVVVVRRGGEVLEIPRARVAAVEDEDIDPRQVWTPDQLYERHRERVKSEGVDLAALTARDHWRLASYAEWAGAYDQARAHYQAAAEDPEYVQREVAAQRLTRVEGLLRDKAALATLRDIRVRLSMGIFAQARKLLEGFADAHPEAGEIVQQRLERLRSDFEQERASAFQKLAGREFSKIVERMIEQKVKDKEILITEVTTWTRRELADAAFAALGERMAAVDQATPEEVQGFWDRRPRRSWRKVTYGAGTFIVAPAKLQAPKSTGGGAKKRSPSGSGPSVPLVLPKPPSRDKWWKEADTRERKEWTLAYFVENSGLFETGDREFRQCRICNGEGLQHMMTQTGQTVSYLCTRCGGAKTDVIVKFR